MVKNLLAIKVARGKSPTNAVTLAETVLRKIAEISDSEPNRYTYSLTVPELLEGADILIEVDDCTGWISLTRNMGDQAIPDNGLIKAHRTNLQKMVDDLSKIIDMKVMLVLRTGTTTFSVTSS